MTVIAPTAKHLDYEASDILDEVAEYVRRYVILPSTEAYDMVALFVVHTHASDVLATTPRLAVLSPEKGSGKTRLLEVLQRLVREPVLAANFTAAAICRLIEDRQPTILFDEIDTVYGRGRGASNEMLRAVINSGHRSSGSTVRASPGGGIVSYSTYCPVVLAGIGDLPDTILDRSIVIRMKRRAPSETVAPFRLAEDGDGSEIRSRIVDWTRAHRQLLGGPPRTPLGLYDREADVFEPLVVIADAAGGEWPERAREAARFFAESRLAHGTGSLGNLLLGDLRRVWGDAERRSSQELLALLADIEDRPWSRSQSNRFSSHSLAALLKQYDIHPRDRRFHDKVLKGYARADLVDSWSRWLPSL